MIWRRSQACSSSQRAHEAARKTREDATMYEAVRAKPGPEAVAWHAVPADQVVRRLKTDPAKGLDANEASQRLAEYGPNRLPEGKKRGPFVRFLAQLNNILVYVLL